MIEQPVSPTSHSHHFVHVAVTSTWYCNTPLHKCKISFTFLSRKDISSAKSQPSCFAFINATLVPLRDLVTNAICSFHSCSTSRLSIDTNSCINRTMVYEASVNANCWPRQIRSPPLKLTFLPSADIAFGDAAFTYGIKPHPGRSDASSQRSGRNSSASGPNVSVKRCRE